MSRIVTHASTQAVHTPNRRNNRASGETMRTPLQGSDLGPAPFDHATPSLRPAGNGLQYSPLELFRIVNDRARLAQTAGAAGAVRSTVGQGKVQATTAILAQANAWPQNVFQLLGQ